MSGAVRSSPSDPFRAGDFEVWALFDALDRQGREQGLSWKEVAAAASYRIAKLPIPPG
jgi:hypothetical protein